MKLHKPRPPLTPLPSITSRASGRGGAEAGSIDQWVKYINLLINSINETNKWISKCRSSCTRLWSNAWAYEEWRIHSFNCLINRTTNQSRNRCFRQWLDVRINLLMTDRSFGYSHSMPWCSICRTVVLYMESRAVHAWSCCCSSMLFCTISSTTVRRK